MSERTQSYERFLSKAAAQEPMSGADEDAAAQNAAAIAAAGAEFARWADERRRSSEPLSPDGYRKRDEEAAMAIVAAFLLYEEPR